MMQQWYLDEEIKMIQQLHRTYNEALKDINRNIKKQMERFDPETGDLPQSAIYQIKYQQMLRGQVEDVLNNLQTSQYLLMSDYLDDCYEDGFIGSVFDMHGQGVPLMMPIDRNAMVQAVTLDSKISKGLYTRLGEDITALKKKITSEVSRSILNGTSYAETARQLAGITRIGYNNAIRITRTEGHRIQVTATMDAMEAAKEQGADVVKQWDSTLDGRTRPSHRRVDGEIRELDESFSNGLKFPGDADGRAAEVINCRCALLERARWAVGSGFSKRNNFTGELETFDTPDDYAKFKKDFFSNENVKYMNYVQQMQKKYGTNDFNKVLERMTDQEYKHYTKLLNDNPVYNVKSKTRPIFTPATTLEEAEEYARRFVVKKTWSGEGNISFKGLSVDSANKLNETLLNLFETHDFPKLQNIQPMNFREKLWKGSETTPMAYRTVRSGDLFFNPKIIKDGKTLSKYFAEGERAFEFCAKNIDRFTGDKRKLVETYIEVGRQLVANDAEDRLMAIIQHEMGHHVQNQVVMRDEVGRKIVADGWEKYAVGISGYATFSEGEYIAESFCAFLNGEVDRIDPALKKYFERLMK